MQPNDSNSKTTDWEWVGRYQERLGKEAFYQFLDMIYKWLMNLKPGQNIDINSHPKITDRNRELFIHVGRLFISEGNAGYEFTNGFTQIKNNSYVPEVRKTKNSKDMEKQGKRVSVR